VRALAVVDGEHYAPVVRDALAGLPYEFIGAWLAGGTEKLRNGFDVGVPLFETLEAGLASAELVVDLSDEPVLGPRERLLVASRALAAGLPYVGADFRFDPPELHPVATPSLAVIGTGKRVGKTAVTCHVARLYARERDVVVVSMGRGGPAEPVVLTSPPTLDDLLGLSRAGSHAASDHLETAAFSRVTTIGCRRCGGGLAGATFASNVVEGARLAAELSPDLIVFDGSGAAVPPVKVGARLLVAHDVSSGLNAYRVLISDLVLTMSDRVAEEADALGADVVRFDLRLRPAEPLAGRRAALFTAGPAPFEHLPEVVFTSRNLADRRALHEDLRSVDAEVFVVELKAAAIDVVAEAAAERGVELVLAENELVAAGLDERLLALADQAVPA